MVQSDDIQVYETEIAILWFDKDGILCARSKNTPRTLERQKSTYALIRLITDNQKVCLYSDMTHSALVMQDDKTREYIAEEMPKLFKAMAVLSVTAVEKAGPTIFINMMNQPVPIRTFDTETEAKEWLKQFMKDQL